MIRSSPGREWKEAGVRWENMKGFENSTYKWNEVLHVITYLVNGEMFPHY